MPETLVEVVKEKTKHFRGELTGRLIGTTIEAGSSYKYKANAKYYDLGSPKKIREIRLVPTISAVKVKKTDTLYLSETTGYVGTISELMSYGDMEAGDKIYPLSNERIPTLTLTSTGASKMAQDVVPTPKKRGRPKKKV